MVVVKQIRINFFHATQKTRLVEIVAGEESSELSDTFVTEKQRKRRREKRKRRKARQEKKKKKKADGGD